MTKAESYFKSYFDSHVFKIKIIYYKTVQNQTKISYAQQPYSKTHASTCPA